MIHDQYSHIIIMIALVIPSHQLANNVAFQCFGFDLSAFCDHTSKMLLLNVTGRIGKKISNKKY